MLLVRALAAFVALPGVVAFLVPLLIEKDRALGPYPHPEAALALLYGLAVLLAAVREFYRAGRGTLAPWSPPARLVTSGPYRLSRNPMYIGVAAILAGWAWLFASLALALYALGVVVAFHLRVILYEEPLAARRFASEWSRYRARVPRWLF